MKATFITLIIALLANGCSGDPNEKFAYLTWTDADKAMVEDTDFGLQGEYGSIESEQAWGVQVVALGGGRFDAYLLEAGLPGLGWNKEKSRTKLTGKRLDQTIQLATEDQTTTATIAKGIITVVRKGETIATLPRIERESPTLGGQAPEDAVVLFDGSSTDAWLNAKIENGLLLNSDVTTKETFDSYKLHLEFRTPYKPYARDQQRGNSGVYHQARFETQVLDSFGLEGEMNETGGIYSIADPLLNMCYPPLRWQTYDVDFTAAKFDANKKLLENARMTVRLNGVVVQDNQELPHTTTGSPTKEITTPKGPIYIQHHGNPVYYRNIWLLPRENTEDISTESNTESTEVEETPSVPPQQ